MIKKLLALFQSDGKGGGTGGASKKTGYIVILALAGLMFLIIGNIFSTPEENGSANGPPEEMQLEQDQLESPPSDDVPVTADVDELEQSFKQEMEGMLNKIQGVSEAEVMVNLDSTNINVYEKNLIKGQQTTDENDKNGGTRKVEDTTEESQVVLVRQGDKEVPLLTQTEKPEVRGVFVVAKGADHASVKKWIVEAVSRVLDVPSHRVSVMPKK
ncbi:stage III sporulation protein AG [Virgibacillus xinjiangensis]|uniref:Stage III sporulation protein AG n=1 Tax=Virgibacillus xinjiangensis TaxID=393090 RepID=A0ABV7CRI2_9BACI